MDGAICRRFEATTRQNRPVLRCCGCLGVALSGSLNTSSRYTDGPVYTVSIMEFRDGKVAHETQYFAEPFEAPAWRAQWVEQTRK